MDGDDIHVDGVNIAARLERLDEPGGICISGAVHEHVRTKLDVSCEDLGAHSVKNIVPPVRVYLVRLDARGPTSIVAGPGQERPSTQRVRPSLAVLPLANLSGDPEQAYFADGIPEDIITELSRFHSLFAIAGNSSFAFRNKDIDVKDVGDKWGAICR